VTTEYDETGNNGFDSLYYYWCTGNCHSAGAQWQSARVETSDHLQIEWPAGLPAACTGGEWHYLAPVLALNTAGVPRIASDTGHIAKCEYDPGSGAWQPGGPYSYSTVWRAAHVALFAQP
jgi:hypothetical protein